MHFTNTRTVNSNKIIKEKTKNEFQIAVKMRRDRHKRRRRRTKKKKQIRVRTEFTEWWTKNAIQPFSLDKPY